MACNCGGSSTRVQRTSRKSSRGSSQAQSCQCQKGGTSIQKSKSVEECSINPFALSCEQKNALANCFRTAICDALRCLDDALCGQVEAEETRNTATTDGGTNTNTKSALNLQTLTGCLTTAVCSLAHCIPDALCPPETECLPPPEALPCDFAVEGED